jgi:hypothetical protein
MKIRFVVIVPIIIGIFTLSTCATGTKSLLSDPLAFDPSSGGTEMVMTLFNGKTVKYRAYEHIFYVSNVVDPVFQYLNFYVPETAYTNNAKTPIFLKTDIGGYRAQEAAAPLNTNATGRALVEGYIVVIPGSRGWTSTVELSDGSLTYTGRAPAGLIDLKAAVRYLRHNDAVMPGNAECIISDGISAGGAMSALLGVTGNNPAYEPYLRELGAANERDDVFATIAFCPVTDLEHADMAFEWLYGNTSSRAALSPEEIAISKELAVLYPAYLNSLGLKTSDGTLLTAENYKVYLKSFLIESAQKARNGGMDMLVESGVKSNDPPAGMMGPPQPGEFVVDIDLDTYFNYTIGKQSFFKTPPAFDRQGVLIPQAAGELGEGENAEFGDETGNGANFTNFGLRKATGNPTATLDPVIQEKVYLLNPMNFIGDGVSNTAQYWYIRHGASDLSLPLEIPINLFTKLVNSGYDVDFALAWNRGHMGDYDLDDVFSWISEVVKR